MNHAEWKAQYLAQLDHLDKLYRELDELDDQRQKLLARIIKADNECLELWEKKEHGELEEERC